LGFACDEERLLNLNGKRRLPLVRQTEAAECGLACLAMIACYWGHRVDLTTLRRRHPISLKGVTLRGLMHVADQLHLSCRALRFEMENLEELRLPVIAHWNLNHFVVLESVTRKKIVVHDPGAGERSYSRAEASKHLTGVALELSPAEGFLRKDDRAKLPFSVFWKQMRGSTHAVLQILLLSVLLELFVLAAPFYPAACRR
jgi:ATP-binding cassette, subfamily B, bacterial CvaB/MchF/RaxB